MQNHPTVLRLTAVAAAVATLCSCAGYTKPVRPGEAPSANDAFLYGRFKIEAPKAFLGFDGYQTMGYAFSCTDGARYTIRFSIEQPVQAIRTAAATCSLEEIVFSNADGQIRGRKPSPAGVMKDLKLQPGVAYYLGDYYASTGNVVNGNVVRTTWDIKDIRREFATTTSEMQGLYPVLANLPTEDRSPTP